MLIIFNLEIMYQDKVFLFYIIYKKMNFLENYKTCHRLLNELVLITFILFFKIF